MGTSKELYDLNKVYFESIYQREPIDEKMNAGLKAYLDKKKAGKTEDKEENGNGKNGKASKGSKPDFLDLDKDGDKKEPMKKAAKDKAKTKKENFEVGTKARRDHTLDVTPGQSPEEFEQQVSVMHKKKNSMREALAKMWGIDEGKNPFDKKEDKKYNKKEGKTLTGKPETKVEVEPKMEKKK